MERQRNGSESETGESDTPGDVIPQNFNLPRPNSRTRTSSEEELTLLSENADPNVQDPHQRHSLFWPPSSTPDNPARRTRGSASATYHWNNIPPCRVRQNRPWSSRERYFSTPHIMNQQLPYLYYRQYLRQEILRSYMAPVNQLRDQFLLRHQPMPLPLPAFAYNSTGNRPIMQLRRAYVAPQNIRHGNSGSSSGSNGSNSSPSSLTGSQPNPNGVPMVERFNFIGMGETDIHNNTDLLLKQDETEDDMTCVICMSLTTKLELLRKLPCRHIFHKDCIDKWLGFNGICPTCRRDVRLRRQSTPPASH
ncbi:E3 ubiquitin-protein ligase RLIM-like isoform X2 [Chrysoperla carnea]|uniref:E3 ubiquitin-protein ligase RLIM-like isoform X2 n=1 Tax=Chrysoperla carnea TaxID=189513 RepID=UPI001D06429A|nr:E3 ubiquitin-protein ligase RLIM-like isoform X2 [Chrysoperla carnea]